MAHARRVLKSAELFGQVGNTGKMHADPRAVGKIIARKTLAGPSGSSSVESSEGIACLQLRVHAIHAERVAARASLKTRHLGLNIDKRASRLLQEMRAKNDEEDIPHELHQ